MWLVKYLNVAINVLVLGAVCGCANARAQTLHVGADRRQPWRAIAAVGAEPTPVHRTVPGKLKFTVVERAMVTPCWMVTESCRQKGGARVAWILPEGTTVLAGQPVCQLGVNNESGLIFASLSGTLVYPPEFDRHAGQPIGATVRNGAKIFTIVDTHGPMQLDVKVHERAIDHIASGLKARIKFDAFPGQSFTGRVSEVAVLPDPICFFNGWVKTYTAKIRIDHAPASLRPGMTAEVEILPAELDNVLCVPLEAVVHEDDKARVAVQVAAGRFAWCDVTLGQSNDRCVEVKDGILSGDLVATRPRALLLDQQFLPSNPSSLSRQ